MKKTNPKKVAQKPAGSEIIRQCVIYVQAMAAYNAGFTADITPDWDHCGSNKGREGGKHLETTEHALRRLIAISPVHRQGALTTAELFAKASVLTMVLDQEGSETATLEGDETAYVRLFAREVADHCRAETTHADKRNAEASLLSAAARTVLESIAGSAS